MIATIESWDIHFEVPGEGSRQVYSGKAMLAVADVLLARQDLVHQRFFRVGDNSKVVLVVEEEELPSWLANPTEERIFLLYPLEGSPAFRVVGAFDNTEENLRTLGMR